MRPQHILSYTIEYKYRDGGANLRYAPSVLPAGRMAGRCAPHFSSWFLNKMVSQNTLRTHDVKTGIFREKKNKILPLFRYNQMRSSNRNS